MAWLVKLSAKGDVLGPMSADDVRRHLEGYPKAQVRGADGGRWRLASNTIEFMGPGFRDLRGPQSERDDSRADDEQQALTSEVLDESPWTPPSELMRVATPPPPHKVYEDSRITIFSDALLIEGRPVGARSIAVLRIEARPRHPMSGQLIAVGVVLGLLGAQFGYWITLLPASMIAVAGLATWFGDPPTWALVNWTKTTATKWKSEELLVSRDSAWILKIAGIIRDTFNLAPGAFEVPEMPGSLGANVKAVFVTMLFVLPCMLIQRSCDESAVVDQQKRIAEQQQRADEARAASDRRAAEETERQQRQRDVEAAKQARNARCDEWQRTRANMPQDERAKTALAQLASMKAPDRGVICDALDLLSAPAASTRTAALVGAIAQVNAKKAELFASERAESSKRLYLKCGDGTTSDSCLCAAPHRGCCSHHKGVAGCEPAPADEPCGAASCPF